MSEHSEFKLMATAIAILPTIACDDVIREDVLQEGCLMGWKMLENCRKKNIRPSFPLVRKAMKKRMMQISNMRHKRKENEVSFSDVGYQPDTVVEEAGGVEESPTEKLLKKHLTKEEYLILTQSANGIRPTEIGELIGKSFAYVSQSYIKIQRKAKKILEGNE